MSSFKMPSFFGHKEKQIVIAIRALFSATALLAFSSQAAPPTVKTVDYVTAYGAATSPLSSGVFSAPLSSGDSELITLNSDDAKITKNNFFSGAFSAYSSQSLSTTTLNCPSEVAVGSPINCFLTAIYSDGSRSIVDNSMVSWSLSDYNIATVDGNGRITANNAGIESINAFYSSGGITKSDYQAVTIRNSTQPTNSSQSLSTTTLNCPSEVTVGSPINCFLTAIYSDGSRIVVNNSLVAWSLSDYVIAAIDDGGKITANNVGIERINASYSSGGITKYDYQTVIIKNSSQPTYSSQSLSTAILSCPNEVAVGAPINCFLTAIYTDGSRNIIDNSMVSWNLSDYNIATLDSIGKITTNYSGVEKISASYYFGGITKSDYQSVIIKNSSTCSGTSAFFNPVYNVVCLPTVAVPSVFGGSSYYQVELSLIMGSNPLKMTLKNATQISSPASASASYNPNSNSVNIPALQVFDAFGGKQNYQIELSAVSGVGGGLDFTLRSAYPSGSAMPTPTCVAPQVLQGSVCVTPTVTPAPTTCVAPQVLQNSQCVTPTVSCVSPQVLQNGQCVTPTPTCASPQVLQNGQCVTPTPTCVSPQVLQNGQCVTPTPTCEAPQMLQGGVCVTPPAPVNQPPYISSAQVTSTPQCLTGCSGYTYKGGADVKVTFSAIDPEGGLVWTKFNVYAGAGKFYVGGLTDRIQTTSGATETSQTFNTSSGNSNYGAYVGLMYACLVPYDEKGNQGAEKCTSFDIPSSGGTSTSTIPTPTSNATPPSKQ